jgi:Complex 1 protein (LYR family)
MRVLLPLGIWVNPKTMSSTKFRTAPLSLDQFLQRQRVLSLWREIVRATNKIPLSNTRNEMRQYARQGFERNRNVTDLIQIRYLISTGKTELEGMQRYINELAA